METHWYLHVCILIPPVSFCRKGCPQVQVLLFTDPESREKITFIEIKLYQITQIQHKIHENIRHGMLYNEKKTYTHMQTNRRWQRLDFGE